MVRLLVPFSHSPLLPLFLLCCCAVVQAQTTAPLKAADPQNAALLAYKEEQIALWDEQKVLYGGLMPGDLDKYAENVKARASQIAGWSGDAVDPTLNFQERAYFAPDGSPQPYWVTLPNDYTPNRKWPLVVYLHGYTSATSKIMPSLPSIDMIAAAHQRGFIMVIPYGRRNSDFVQWGEDDVLRVKREVIEHYSIDTGRVFLLGVSMGGYGAYAMALHQPAEWDAVAAISGRSDFYLWFNINRDDQPAWKRALYDADDPRFLARNARNTPFFTQHGAFDYTVPVEQSRRYAADARELGLPFRYLEQSDGDHSSEYHLAAVTRALDWFSIQPTIGAPRKIEMVAVDGRETKNSWARIEAFETYGEATTLKAEVDDGSIHVTTQNVARFVLEPPNRLMKGARTTKLFVNDVESPQVYDSLQPIAWEKAGAKLEKTPTRCGPFKNLLRDPFLLVYGDEDDKKAAARFAQEWKDNADGIAPLKAATDITEADKANFNLIFFGTRETNPMLALISDQLPLELTSTGYRIGTKAVEAPGVGLRMVWKSPWNDKRMIGVCSGQWWGGQLPINHKLDLVPDYLVYGIGFEKDDTNTALEAGFFDGNWELVKP